MRALAFAALAVPASAFLIAPELEPSILDVETLPDDIRDAWSRTIQLDCPRCPVRMPHTGKVTTEIRSHLTMDFQVDLANGADRLLLNGFEIYPHADPFGKLLMADHIVDLPEVMMVDGIASEVDILGFTLLSKDGPSTADTPLGHIEIDLQIIEVGNVFVDGIPSVHINLLKDANGMIVIDNIESGSPDSVSTAPAEDKEPTTTCESWFCGWITSLKNHWNHWRPHCAMGSKSRPHDHPHQGPGQHKSSHHEKPHHGHHGGHMSAHHRKPHSWTKVVTSIAVYIILPVLIGIAAGLLISIGGMVLGAWIVHVYRQVSGSRCPRRTTIAATHAKNASQEEKDGLMDHQEPPPSYEEGISQAEPADSKV